MTQKIIQFDLDLNSVSDAELDFLEKLTQEKKASIQDILVGLIHDSLSNSMKDIVAG